MRIFEWLFGIMVLVALMSFMESPRKAMDDVYKTVSQPTPRFFPKD